MEFTNLPDEVIVHVLKNSSPSTVAKFRRMNRRMNDLINHHRLGRPVVDEFSVTIRTAPSRSAPMGRIQLKKNSNQMKRKVMFTMKRKNKHHHLVEEENVEGPSNPSESQIIEKTLKTVKLANRVSFDGINVDSSFHKMVTSRWNDLSSVNNLTFTLCRMNLTEEELTSILLKTGLNSLTLDFCHFHTDVINDKILRLLPELECLRIQPRSPLYLAELTDNTLRAWSQKPPRTIALYNCITSFTIQGIVDFVKVVPNTEAEWDFGRVLPSTNSAEALLSLTMTPGVTVNVSDDYRSRRIQVDRLKSKIAFNLLTEEIFT
ncbi:unnamed protein product [Auanema sp. JU1783]|nr:unnamed protein product [Auanema sp. JU1783]